MCYQYTMINKNTYLPTFVLIFVACMLSSNAFAQENLETKSGQILTVAADGSYTYRADESKSTEDEDQFMGIELNALEDPNNAELSGDRQERSILRSLKSQLQDIEAKSTVARYQFKEKIRSLSDKLKIAKKAKNENEVISLENQLNALDVDYDLADMRAEESYNFIKKVNDIATTKPEERADKINDLVAKSAKTLGTTVKSIQSTKVDYVFEVDDRNPEYISHDKACDITYNGLDKSLNQKRIEHAPQHLFGHTSEKLKHFLKSENFLNCSAYLTQLDGDYYLNLDLDLATKDASRNYGFIDKDDMVKLTFINGDNFVANSIYRAEGKLEPYSGHTKYEAIYRLQDIEMELIEDLELDKVAIIWSSGFEEYPVYEIDLLQRQLECLKKAE